MREYSSSRYSSSRFCGYVRDFIVETWERRRPWGIEYESSDKFFTTPLDSARSSAYVTECTSLPIPIYLVLDFFLICLFAMGVVFFPAKQLLIIVA